MVHNLIPQMVRHLPPPWKLSNRSHLYLHRMAHVCCILQVLWLRTWWNVSNWLLNVDWIWKDFPRWNSTYSSFLERRSYWVETHKSVRSGELSCLKYAHCWIIKTLCLRFWWFQRTFLQSLLPQRRCSWRPNAHQKRSLCDRLSLSLDFRLKHQKL